MPDAPRCGVCGKFHPLISVCPFIKEQEVREEFVGHGRERKLVAHIIRTVYFPRPQLDEASIVSLEEETSE